MVIERAEKGRELFGTDGIRGVANQHPMTPEIALSLGRALAFTFQNGNRHRRILIGKDTRLSGYMIELALASGITSMGADVLLVGPMTTSGVAFLTQGMRAEAGVMISASHNLFRDNGIKVFDHEGYKLADSSEKKLEELVFADNWDQKRPPPERIGKAFRVEEARGRYIEFLKGSFPKDLSLEGLRIVLDAAHGAAYEVAPTVFEELGAEVIRMGVDPDGTNINTSGAICPEKAALRVLETGAHAGIALDGDADRVIFIDEMGRVIDGDAIVAVCGEDLLKQGMLRDGVVVGTVMSNMAVEEYLRNCGGRLVRTAVGDRYVVESMRENGYLFGGESSGHLIFRQYTTTGDGILAALQVLALSLKRKEGLSNLVSRYQPYPQVLKNVKVREKRELGQVPAIARLLEQAERSLAGAGRILVRYSGTEPLVRVMVEGRDRTRIEMLSQEIATTISSHLS